MREAKRAHLLPSAAIQHRETDLVGRNRDAVLDEYPQVRRVEVGHADMADQAFLTQHRQLDERIQVGRMLEAPPVKLQQVNRINAQPVEAALHAGAHDRSGHRTRRRAPLREYGWAIRARVFSRAKPLEKAPADDLSAAVVIGHVEAVEARARVVEHR